MTHAFPGFFHFGWELIIVPAAVYVQVVIPAKAGIQTLSRRKPGTGKSLDAGSHWTPAFAGVTDGDASRS
jgi:hypothetical protein